MMEVIFKILFKKITYGKPDGIYFEGSLLSALAVLAFLITIFLSSLVWLWIDAEKRNKSGIIAVIFVITTGWPFSFIWWFWLRPQVSRNFIA